MKTCFKCQRELPLAEFYKHPTMRDGRMNKCKECTKSDVAANRLKNIDRYREYDRNRGNRQTKDYLDDYAKKYPQARRAKSVLSYAIRSGKMMKESCEVCGSGESIHAHHDDYAYPLTVRWLCAEHHAKWHRDNGPGINRRKK